MIPETGDMWEMFGHTDLIVVTTNAYITSTGRLAMGRGAALEARTRCPGIDKMFANFIQEQCTSKWLYGLIVVQYGRQSVGAFQVKRHYAHNADPDIIGYSASMLRDWVRQTRCGRVDMNFPGIGYGKLDRASVLELIEPVLPDQVHVWEKPAEKTS